MQLYMSRLTFVVYLLTLITFDVQQDIPFRKHVTCMHCIYIKVDQTLEILWGAVLTHNHNAQINVPR